MNAVVTPRLRGLPLSEADSDDLYALHRDERVLAAFGAEPATAEETREFLDRKLAHRREPVRNAVELASFSRSAGVRPSSRDQRARTDHHSAPLLRTPSLLLVQQLPI